MPARALLANLWPRRKMPALSAKSSSPPKSFSVSPSKLKVGDELQLLPSGCKIKVDWNLKSPKMELKNRADGEAPLRWLLSEVSEVVFVTTPGEEVCMRLHLDTDTPEGRGGAGGGTEEGGAHCGPLAAAVRGGALRRGWKVVYLQRQDADKALASLQAWSATKAPGLKVTEERRERRLSSAHSAAREVEAAIVAAGLAATVRIGITGADIARASAHLAGLRACGRPVEPASCAAGAGWVLGIGSGFLVDEGGGKQPLRVRVRVTLTLTSLNAATLSRLADRLAAWV